MKDTNTIQKFLFRCFLIVILSLSGVQTGFAQIELLPGQKLKKWNIPPGNYSGIMPLGDNRYAVVSDKQEEDGFYEFRILQNETTGKVEDVELIAFHGNKNQSRDAEGITFFPDSSTVFISAEDDQSIAEYALDGTQTGRKLEVPETFSLRNIYGNYGFEALAFSDETGLFWTCTENSLRSDGILPTAENPVSARLRLQSFDRNLTPAQQYFYQTDMPKPGKRHRKIVAGVPEILALDNGKLLIMEREVMTTANNIGNRTDTRIYLFSPEDSVKTLQAQWTTKLNITQRSFANYEGMCYGAKLKDGRQTILIISDAQNGAGNAVFHLKDYIRVGILNGSSLLVAPPDDIAEIPAAPSDTAVHIPKAERVLSNRWVQTACTSGALIAAGFLVKGHTRHFRSLRNDFTPHYKVSFDDYLQYSPMVVSYLLKFAGVEGRSTWGKRLTANIVSLTLVNLVSDGLKDVINVARPDGSNHQSMPSHHTAGAFMAATLLYKEYGSYSPWVGYSAYTVATATGVMRMMRNKHWLSDILVGAGIGIVGAEFAYWVSDLAFPSQPKSFDSNAAMILDDAKNPHFIGPYAGFYVPIKGFSAGEKRSLHSSNGGTMGIEGAYFLNRNVGIGGQISLSDISYTDETGGISDLTSRFYSLKTGCFFAYSVLPRVAFGGKVLCGYTCYPQGRNNVIDGKSASGISGLIGLNLNLRAGQHLVFRVGADYEVLPSPSSELSGLQTLLLTGGAFIRF